ncbi:UNVERIFIED_CONTAM: hypothetical protein K2H54_050441 [Gekko kuhli]
MATIGAMARLLDPGGDNRWQPRELWRWWPSTASGVGLSRPPPNKRQHGRHEGKDKGGQDEESRRRRHGSQANRTPPVLAATPETPRLHPGLSPGVGPDRAFRPWWIGGVLSTLAPLAAGPTHRSHCQGGRDVPRFVHALVAAQPSAEEKTKEDNFGKEIAAPADEPGTSCIRERTGGLS